MELQIPCYVLAAAMVIVGLVGVILPALPGLPLVFLGMLLAAYADNFVHVGAKPLILLGVLVVISLLVDLLSSLLGAKKAGASRIAIVGAAIGTVAGLFFMPWGILLGPFIGALSGELWHGRHLGKAAKVGLGTWLGLLSGTVLKLALAFAMLGVFVFAWFY